MAKDSSKGTGAGGGGSVSNLQIGDDKIDLSESPLVYGEKMAGLSGTVRKTVEDWEARRISSKIEYSYGVDANGAPIAETRGGKGSVTTPSWIINQSEVFSHIHPRREGVLGGTFSPGDIEGLGKTREPYFRAAAKEGTYTIARKPNLDADGLLKAYTKIHNDSHRKAEQRGNRAYDEYKRGQRTYESYASEVAKANNAMLVEQHNWLRNPQNQKTYGYAYTLERR